ncbi:hypothetical protein [Bifidobacterium longum]|uniref:hypothetical protein n=1 Tax=Bifidobacterium longum TaxID=216816 RepID=UPI003F579B6F
MGAFQQRIPSAGRRQMRSDIQFRHSKLLVFHSLFVLPLSYGRQHRAPPAQPTRDTTVHPTKGDPSIAVAGTPKDDTGLERKMESRHLTMISLGGVIGTGLFVSSGYTIHQAGPLGAILAYAAGSLLVYCVMVRWASCPWPYRMPAASTCMRSGSSAPAPRSPSPSCIG